MLFSPQFSGVDQKDLQLGQEKILRVCSKTWVSVPEHHLCQFVSYQAEGKLCHSTIKCYLSAARQMHVAEGYGDPCMSSMARLEQVLKGIKSLQARTRGRSSHNPRSAAQNERGVAEKRYHLGQHDAMGSGNPCASSGSSGPGRSQQQQPQLSVRGLI